MSLIESFKAKGILQPAGTPGRYGIDFNGKPGIQEEEVIPDNNKNGKTDLKEALEFIVHRVSNPVIIEKINSVIDTETDEAPQVLDFIRMNYQSNRSKKLENTHISEITGLIMKYNSAFQAKLNAVVEMESDQVRILQNTCDLIEVKLRKWGETISFDQKFKMKRLELQRPLTMILPNGMSALVKWVAVDNVSKAVKVGLKKNITVKLPNGYIVITSGVVFDPAGKIIGARLAKAYTMKFQDHTTTVLKGQGIYFKSNGELKHIIREVYSSLDNGKTKHYEDDF